jgi:hypothetical protein
MPLSSQTIVSRANEVVKQLLPQDQRRSARVTLVYD